MDAFRSLNMGFGLISARTCLALVLGPEQECLPEKSFQDHHRLGRKMLLRYSVSVTVSNNALAGSPNLLFFQTDASCYL